MFVWSDGDLDAEQVSAIKEDANVFLVACPGSGKTRTLTYKIAYELSRLSSKKSVIIAITYTHRAADEIHERIEALGVDTTQLWIGTIHSFCLEWILKPYCIYHEKLSHGFRVINSHDADKILQELCGRHKGSNVAVWDCTYYCTETEPVISCLSAQKHETIRAILNDYFEILACSRQIDFELMLRYAHDLIVANPTIAILLSRMFPLILVDEYQDTKSIQYSIISAILKTGAGETRAFIVGDPNQAIFQSLGGFPIDASAFAERAGIPFKEMRLWRNYRSSARIVEYFGNYKVHDTQIESASNDRDYASLISFNQVVHKEELEDELIRLIKHNIEVAGIAPEEICILAPWWVSLAGMTRRLVAHLPEYDFDGPGMVPFARDIDNFWYKLSKIVLTKASPGMFVRRHRWAGEIIRDLGDAGAFVSGISRKSLLRKCNAIEIAETDGLDYLRSFFDVLFTSLRIDYQTVPMLSEHHVAFFEAARDRIERLKRDGAEFIGEIENFRKVFENRKGITISTIHGIKGDEYDAVIAYALLEGMVPHFNDAEKAQSANKMLYVICSRARKNLHLIAERGRPRRNAVDYDTTEILAACVFGYDIVP